MEFKLEASVAKRVESLVPTLTSGSSESSQPEHHTITQPEHHNITQLEHYNTTQPEHYKITQHYSTRAPQHYSNRAPQHYSMIMKLFNQTDCSLI